MHLEINAWEHILDLMYKEAIYIGVFQQFIETLKNSPKEGGCGLSLISRGIEEHYASEKTRYIKLSARLIGEQAIKLARYSCRLIDGLYLNSKGSSSKIKCLALGKMTECLRDIGAMISRVNVSHDYPREVQNICRYFLILFLSFSQIAVKLLYGPLGTLFRIMLRGYIEITKSVMVF